MTGVRSRATSSENTTAIATEMPNWRKNCPGTLDMKLTGMNTATMVSVVATTARPISSDASSAACIGVLPMRMWRTMFSTSTIASSTRMPTTSDRPSSVIRLSVKPSHDMK